MSSRATICKKVLCLFWVSDSAQKDFWVDYRKEAFKNKENKQFESTLDIDQSLTFIKISRKWRFYFTFEASFFFSNEGTRAFNLRNSLFLAYLRYFLTTFCPANNVRSNCLRWLLDRGGVLNSYLDGLRILNFIRFK